MIRRFRAWLARRRFLAAKMRDLMLVPKWWQSNRARSLEIMMFLTLPRDLGTRGGIRRYVAWLLQVPTDRVTVHESTDEMFLVITVPRRTSPAKMADVAAALDRNVPWTVSFRVERAA